MKHLFIGLGISVLTLVIMLGVSEVITRQFLNPLDYLQPILISDSDLGHRIAPYSGGHDAWGFRNRSVPEKAHIVVIGDSQIYKTASTSENSISSLLRKELGEEVYNMALGGYGAAHYSILLGQAFKLSPKTVLLGIYFGNDFMDTFNYVYDRDHALFSSMRQPKFSGTDTFKPVKFERENEKTFQATRSYLARHSVLYRAVTSSPFFDVFRKYEQKHSKQPILEISDSKGDLIARIALERARQIDLSDPRIEEGVRLTLHFIDDIKSRCDAAGVKLAVILIPSQFSSFKHEIGLNPVFALEARKAVKHEGLLFDQFHSKLSQRKIRIIDIRKPIQDAVKRGERVYPVNDGHPNNHGNWVIANYISEQLLTTDAQ